MILALFDGSWQRMSDEPTIQTVGKAEIRWHPVRVLAALGACLLFQAYFIPFTNGSVSDIAQFSSALETGSSPSLDVSSLIVLPSYDTGTSHKPLALAGDFLACVETEDPDPLTKIPGTLKLLPKQVSSLRASSPATTLLGHVSYLCSRFMV